MELTDLKARDGSTISIHECEERDILEARDPRGVLMFRYDTETGQGTVHMPGFDVRLREGQVELACKQDLRISSAGSVEIEGGGSRLGLASQGTHLEAPRFELSSDEVLLQGKRAEVCVEEARLSASRVEYILGRVWRFAREVYESVEGLLHVRAGRARTDVSGGYRIQAKRARIRTEEDVTLEGETINLG